MCGAAAEYQRQKREAEGLSPRVWGSLHTLPPLHVRDRSIPTCVGQPPRRRTGRSILEVYPHVCGAAEIQELQNQYQTGLSPRVWGSRQEAHEGTDTLRSIPTCVGQPLASGTQLTADKVYPHVCGAA